jgi:hypothetical protein
VPELLGNVTCSEIPEGDGNLTWVGVMFDHPVSVTPDDIIGFTNYATIGVSGLPFGNYYENYLPYWGDFEAGTFNLYITGVDVMGSPADFEVATKIAEDVATPLVTAGDAATLASAKGADEHIIYDVDGNQVQGLFPGDMGFTFTEAQEMSELYVKMSLQYWPMTCEVSDDNNLTWKVWHPWDGEATILGNTTACDIPLGVSSPPFALNGTAWVGLKFNRTISVAPGDMVGFTKGSMVPSMQAKVLGIGTSYPDSLAWGGGFGPGGSRNLLFFGPPDFTNKLAVETVWPVAAASSAKNISITTSIAASNANHTPLIYDARGTGISMIQTGGSDYGFVFNASGTLDSLYIRARLQYDPTISPGTCQDQNVTFRVWRSPPTSDPEYLGNVPLCDIPFGPANDSVWVGTRFDHAVTVTPSDIIGFDLPSVATLEGPQMDFFTYYPDFQPKWGLFSFNGGFLANNAPDITTRPEIEWQAETRESRIVDSGALNLSHAVDGGSANITAAIAARSGVAVFDNGTEMPLYNLTDSWTEIVGTPQSMEFTTPAAGYYLVTTDLLENWTIETTTTPGNYLSAFALCDATGTDLVPGSTQPGTTLVMGADRLDGNATHHYTWIYGNATGPTQVKVCGRVDMTTGSLDGEWSVLSDANQRTVLGWMRLA